MKQGEDGRVPFWTFVRPGLQHIKANGWFAALWLRLSAFVVAAYLAFRDHDVSLALFLFPAMAAFSLMDRLVDFSAGYWYGLGSGVQLGGKLAAEQRPDDEQHRS